MNVARQRVLNVFGGVVFSVLGATFYGAAAYLVLVPPKAQGQAPTVEADLTSCKRTLGELGMQGTQVGPELRANKQGLDNPERSLADASLAISACGLKMTRFCMGPGCRTPATPDGIFFALSTQVEAKK